MINLTSAQVQEFSRNQVWAYIADNELPVKKLASTVLARKALIEYLERDLSLMTALETVPEIEVEIQVDTGTNTDESESQLSYTDINGLENASSTKVKNMTATTSVKLTDISISTDLFQFRRTEVNQEMVYWLAQNWDESALDPLDVWRDENGKLWLISGHHRYQAAECLELTEIICRIHQCTLEQARTIAAVSNAARLEYLPIEYCNCLEYLVEQGLSIDRAANKMALKLNFANRYYALRLLKGTGWEQHLNTDLLSTAYVVALYAEKSPFKPGELDSLLKIVIDRQMSLAQVKKLLSDLKTVKGAATTKGSQSTLFDLSGFDTDRVVEAVKTREEDNKCRMYSWYTYTLVESNPDIPADIKEPLLKQLRRLNSHLIGSEEPETIPTRTSKKLRVKFPVAA